MQILNFLLVFLLFFGTYLFQVGLIGEVVKEFKPALYIMLLYLGVYGAYAGAKISAFAATPNEDALWDNTSFTALSVIQKIGECKRHPPTPHSPSLTTPRRLIPPHPSLSLHQNTQWP